MKPAIEWAGLAIVLVVPLAFGLFVGSYAKVTPGEAIDLMLGGWMITLGVVCVAQWVSVAGALARVAEPGFRHDLWLTGRSPREVVRGEVFKRWRFAAIQVGAALVCLAVGFQVGRRLGNINGSDMIWIPLLFFCSTICFLAFGLRLLTGMATLRSMNRILGLGIVHVLLVPVLLYVLMVPLIVYGVIYAFSYEDAGMEQRLSDVLRIPAGSLLDDVIFAAPLALVGCLMGAASFLPRIERNLLRIESWFGVFEGRPEPAWAPMVPAPRRLLSGRLAALIVGWLVLSWLHLLLFLDEIIGLPSDDLGIGLCVLLVSGLVMAAACGIVGEVLDQATRRDPGVGQLGVLTRIATWALVGGLATLAIVAAPPIGALIPMFDRAPGSLSAAEFSRLFVLHGSILGAIPVLGLIWIARLLVLAARRLDQPQLPRSAWFAVASACAETVWVVMAVPLVWAMPFIVGQWFQNITLWREVVEEALGLRSYESPVLVVLLASALEVILGSVLVMLAAGHWARVHARWRQAALARESLASYPPATAPSAP